MSVSTTNTCRTPDILQHLIEAMVKIKYEKLQIETVLTVRKCV